MSSRILAARYKYIQRILELKNRFTKRGDKSQMRKELEEFETKWTKQDEEDHVLGNQLYYPETKGEEE